MLQALDRFSLIEKALILCACASASLLAGAHAFENFGGFYPCELCLDQREAHWTALFLALAGLAASLGLRARYVAAASVGALALVYVVSAGLAFYHTGVEWQFWPGPTTCSGAAALADPFDLDALTGAMNEAADAPACDQVAWRMFGISMAGYNFLLSMGLFALTGMAALGAAHDARQARRPRPTPEPGL